MTTALRDLIANPNAAELELIARIIKQEGTPEQTPPPLEEVRRA